MKLRAAVGLAWVLSVPTLSACCLETVAGHELNSGLSSPDGGSCQIDGQSFPARALNPANLGQCCNPKTSPNAWLPLLSPGISGSADGGPNDGVIADFNGDGFPDIAVATSAPQDVFVYFGMPDGGGYSDPYVYPAGRWPIGVTAGDMNGDGIADLIVASAGAIAVVLSKGDGTFEQPRFVQTACGADGMAVADVNGDGWNDLVATACHKVSIFLNLAQGDGALGSVMGLGQQGGEVQVADFNGDGVPDIAWTNGSLGVALRNAAGNFTLAPGLSVAGAGGFAVGQFLGSDSQIAVETGGALELIGFGKGSSAGVLSESKTDTPGQKAIAVDLNGDGLSDVVGFSTTSIGVSISRGGKLADAVDFVVPSRYQIGSGIQMIAGGDLNGDGAADVLVMIGNGPWIQYLNNCP